MDSLDISFFMQHIAKKIKPITLKYFDSDIDISLKDDKSPVTIADKKLEEIIREEITKNFPSHSIIGEEHGYEDNDYEYCWVIDPIDGTKNFATQIPCFATLIALCKNKKPIVGMVAAPALNKVWIGGENLKARVNGKIIDCRKTSELSNAWGSSTLPYFGSDYHDKVHDVFKKSEVNIWGNDAIAFTSVAQGKLDFALETGLKPWDFAAIVPIINSAGGIMSDFKGNELTLNSDGSVLASATAALHEQILSILKN